MGAVPSLPWWTLIEPTPCRWHLCTCTRTRKRIFVRPLDQVFWHRIQPDVPGDGFNGFQCAKNMVVKFVLPQDASRLAAYCRLLLILRIFTAWNRSLVGSMPSARKW